MTDRIITYAEGQQSNLSNVEDKVYKMIGSNEYYDPKTMQRYIEMIQKGHPRTGYIRDHEHGLSSTPFVDQEQLLYTVGSSGIDTSWQTITIGTTGLLTGLDLQFLNNTGDTTVTASIYLGDEASSPGVIAGVAIASDTQALASGGPTILQFTFGSPPLVTSGSVISIGLSRGNPADDIFWYINFAGNLYSGGRHSSGADRDAWFKLYINPNNTGVTRAYNGAVYSPLQNRIYFVPYNQTAETFWHYIDCDTGVVTPYIHGATAVLGAYVGGVYSPTQNRIYFVPFFQAGEANWHYVDCSTGTIVSYAHGVTVPNGSSGGYWGGVYSKNQDRIYFAPSSVTGDDWHYIDCSTGNVISYSNGTSIVNFAYGGGCYSPSEDRIYFSPRAQSSQSTWHYVNCSTGMVISYEHNLSDIATGAAYTGAVFSPYNNRIYFVPLGQATKTDWHYIDCKANTDIDVTIVPYAHNLGVDIPVTSAYQGGVYSPTQNRIYFVPYSQGPQSKWHYVDCDTGNVVPYDNTSATLNFLAYNSGVYSPKQNRIYFAPYVGATLSTWVYIDIPVDEQANKYIMSDALFNKY